VVHTGPKIQLGGVHSGLWSCGYQVFTELLVNNAPIPATARQTTTNGNNDSHDSRSNICPSYIRGEVRCSSGSQVSRVQGQLAGGDARLSIWKLKTDHAVRTSAVRRLGPACVIAAFSFPASRLERPRRFRPSRPALCRRSSLPAAHCPPFRSPCL